MVEFPRQNRQVQKIAHRSKKATVSVDYKANTRAGCGAVHSFRLNLPTADSQAVRSYCPQGNRWTMNQAGVIPGGCNPRGSVDRHPRLANREVSDVRDATHQTAPAARCPHCGVAPDRRAPRPPSTKEAALAFIAECRRKLAGGAR